jgi:hypothetical protein
MCRAGPGCGIHQPNPGLLGREGIRDRPISPQSPSQNGYAERLIGTLRRECLDQMVILGEVHLRRILSGYATYYNQTRTHLALQKDALCVPKTSSGDDFGLRWQKFLIPAPEFPVLLRRKFHRKPLNLHACQLSKPLCAPKPRSALSRGESPNVSAT